MKIDFLSWFSPTIIYLFLLLLFFWPPMSATLDSSLPLDNSWVLYFLTRSGTDISTLITYLIEWERCCLGLSSVRSFMVFVFSKHSCILWVGILFAIIPLSMRTLTWRYRVQAGFIASQVIGERTTSFESVAFSDWFLIVGVVGCNYSCFWYYPSCVYHAYGWARVCSNVGYDLWNNSQSIIISFQTSSSVLYN